MHWVQHRQVLMASLQRYRPKWGSYCGGVRKLARRGPTTPAQKGSLPARVAIAGKREPIAPALCQSQGIAGLRPRDPEQGAP